MFVTPSLLPSAETASVLLSSVVSRCYRPAAHLVPSNLHMLTYHYRYQYQYLKVVHLSLLESPVSLSYYYTTPHQPRSAHPIPPTTHQPTRAQASETDPGPEPT